MRRCRVPISRSRSRILSSKRFGNKILKLQRNLDGALDASREIAANIIIRLSSISTKSRRKESLSLSHPAFIPPHFLGLSLAPGPLKAAKSSCESSSDLKRAEARARSSHARTYPRKFADAATATDRGIG